MQEKLEWKYYKIRNNIDRYIKHKKNQLVSKNILKKDVNRTKINGKVVLDVNRTNQEITNAINDKIPYFVGRFGGSEMNLMYEYLDCRFGSIKDNRKAAVDRLCELSGFFPNDIAMGEKFVALMIESCKVVDVHGIWDLYMEDFFLHRYANNALYTKLPYLSPWIKYKCEKMDSLPWSAALKGKKVLVVHPFADSIKKQYSTNRKKIFSKLYDDADSILPEFELITLKAVQTIAGNKDERFDSWFDALEWMIQECDKLEFDVAILGCGAYGYPLAAHIKKTGKVAIHLGGATQIMFGIVGKRWEDSKVFSEKVLNDSWIRPSADEVPKNMNRVEEGCYW